MVIEEQNRRRQTPHLSTIRGTIRAVWKEHTLLLKLSGLLPPKNYSNSTSTDVDALWHVFFTVFVLRSIDALCSVIVAVKLFQCNCCSQSPLSDILSNDILRAVCSARCKVHLIWNYSQRLLSPDTQSFECSLSDLKTRLIILHFHRIELCTGKPKKVAKTKTWQHLTTRSCSQPGVQGGTRKHKLSPLHKLLHILPLLAHYPLSSPGREKSTIKIAKKLSFASLLSW